MSILKFLICAIISLGLSKAFFSSSVFAMLCIFCVLEYLVENSKKYYVEQKKVPKYASEMLIAACLLGSIVMIIGKNIIYSDVCIIVGAMLFSPALAALIVLQVCNLLEHVKSNRQL